MGVLDSLLLWRDHGRKFIKRKDSDAEEQGRALEKLRSSLYNDFHSSEGAKRHQQRFCGPVVAMTFNFVVSVGIVMANKVVMGRVGFNFPVALSLIHYVITWLLMAIFSVLSLLPPSPPSKSTPYSSLFALGAVMAFSTGLANISLQHNSMGFYQMAKIAVTPTITLAEFILFRKLISFHKVLALIAVSIGVAVATVTDLECNFFGSCVALAWIVPSAVNKILWSNLQQIGNWTALALMWRITPIAIFFYIALMPLMDPPGVLSFNWSFYNMSAILISALFGFLLQWSGALALGTTPIAIFFYIALIPLLDPPGVLSFNWSFNNTAAIFISVLFEFLLQWSGALALGATSATSHVVLGQFKTCVIMLGGYLFFNPDPGFISLCGAAVSLGGMSVYTYLNLQGRHESVAAADKELLSKLNSSLKPKTMEDGEKTDTKTTADSV